MELHHKKRAAIVDLGSNSVRMVVFEGVTRNPVISFNEKHTLRLGKGLDKTGLLNEEGVKKAKNVLARFAIIAHAMRADPFHIVATAAVRDATNGAAFIKEAQSLLPNAQFRILNGEEEADYAANGVLCALPEANGLVADIGGGSLELIHIAQQRYHKATSTHLGVIRLRERSEDSVKKAYSLAQDCLKQVDWLAKMKGKALYLVGGGFRTLARLDIARRNYPLNIVHLLRYSAQEANDLALWIFQSSSEKLEKLGNVSRKRVTDAPYAAAVLLSLIKEMAPSEIIFSANGLREGWYMQHVAESLWKQEPMVALLEELAGRFSRNVMAPELLYNWTTPLFKGPEGLGETGYLARLRYFSCLVSDIGAFAHPQYRAEQSYRLILYNQGVSFDHQTRAFLALVIGIRYGISRKDPLLDISRDILDENLFTHALTLGTLLRLAYSLCAGTDFLLGACHLSLQKNVLSLDLKAGSIRSVGSAVEQRLKRLATELNKPFAIVT
ncbi:Ppx/GppA family phosphatase [Aristophania vespae]|uniref:Ppx/GppA family phosphatase n=1 Tax=Aristophania vespae TaxID=2697033 RepID=A0A6P1NG24_9PROT|nr:Ppx/GppA family phosphatase [Aristophania vespae]QHI95414.1 Ppx/GppA family phosphatase [Aristophania vespae]UMM64698.1 Guanosine-5'-triphosphate,3'-diphosphate pyrophosphatase [Aristophania vespae]